MIATSSLARNLVRLAAVFLWALTMVAKAEVPEGEQLAEARALFDQINQSRKGAFGLNVLQGKYNRTTVRSGRMPEGGLVFQAALRNEPASELADRFGLYTGNLFSPNLYQLFNDFVYKDPSANHDMPMEKLYAVGDEVFPKARKMVLNWVVEKHYIEQFPETQLTRGFLSRGIAGSEFEEKYAREFMSFYLYFMQDELDYLPIYLLAQKSPLLASAELEKVRQKIAVSYDYLKSYYSDDHGRVKPDHREKIDALHKIRNRIHNQLTPDVVPMLDDYLNEIHPTYNRDFGPSRKVFLLTVRSKLKKYFEISWKKIGREAARIPGQEEMLDIIRRLESTPDDSALMLAFSEKLAALRENLDMLKLDKREKVRIFPVVKMGSNAIGVWSKSQHKMQSVAMIQSLLNVMYAEGLLTQAQRDSMLQATGEAGGFGGALAALDEQDLLGSVIGNVNTVFADTLALWEAVQPDKKSKQKIEYFGDNTIKTSEGASTLFFLLDTYPHSRATQTAGQTDAAGSGIKVLNSGMTCGRLAFITREDLEQKNDEALSRAQIPVFESIPTDLTTVAGTITLAKQPRLGHIQIKSKNRGTPNLDVSGQGLGNWQNDFLKGFENDNCVYMKAEASSGTVVFRKVDTDNLAAAGLEGEMEKLCRRNCLGEVDAADATFRPATIELVADLDTRSVLPTRSMSWKNFKDVGSKAANYAELANLLNTPERTVVREGMGIPFFYYYEFVQNNPPIRDKITAILADPKMQQVDAGKYRADQLRELRELFFDKDAWFNEEFLNELIDTFDTFLLPDGSKHTMKLRSSTNSEDLPNFNGAGLYDSKGYKPHKKNGEERSRKGKIKELKDTLATVWASVWNQRAFDERAYFGIPHKDVYMGIQVNPNYPDEKVDGVIVTKDIYDMAKGPAVSIEAQRGNTYSVANPEDGALAEQILVEFNGDAPLDKSQYKITIVRRSNLSADGARVLSADELKAASIGNVMTDEELRDLTWLCNRAQLHFR
ncbi:MAG: PEP/pyruvate-binding domain-containing protein, partial [Chromatiales bacterium]